MRVGREQRDLNFTIFMSISVIRSILSLYIQNAIQSNYEPHARLTTKVTAK